jgi:hypothetical protein
MCERSEQTGLLKYGYFHLYFTLYELLHTHSQTYILPLLDHPFEHEALITFIVV